MLSNAITLVSAVVVGLAAYAVLSHCTRWERSWRAVLGWLLMLDSALAAESAFRGAADTYDAAAIALVAAVCVYLYFLKEEKRTEILTDWGVLDAPAER